MVKFVGGPSVSGYKSYRNHRTAREGQWRMPRLYGGVTNNLTIKVRNYNTGSYGCGWGFQMPEWFYPFKYITDMVGSWIDRFTSRRAPVETPVETQNPFSSELEDLRNEIERLKKENEKLKEDPEVKETEEEDTVVEEPKPSTFTQNTEFDTETTNNEVKTEDTDLTTEVPAQKVKKGSVENGKQQYKAPLWNTLAMSYTYTDENGQVHQAVNNSAFRAAIKEATGLTANIYSINKVNHFPNKITVDGKEYTFNMETYTNEDNWVTYTLGGNATEGATNKKVKPGETTVTTTTTHKGSTTITVDGTPVTFTSSGKKSKKAVVEDLTKQVNDSNLTREQKTKAISNIKIKAEEE